MSMATQRSSRDKEHLLVMDEVYVIRCQLRMRSHVLDSSYMRGSGGLKVR